MHMKDRITQMLLPVLGHADTKHVVPAPCMTLLQRPGRGGGGGGGGGGADAIAEYERWACDTLGRCCSPHKPSPELALYRAGEVHPPASMLRCRLAPGGRWAAAAGRQQRSCAAAEIQQKAAVSSALPKRRLSTKLASQGPRDCCGVAWESPDRRSMPACPAGGAVLLSRGLQRPRDPRQPVKRA
jgi:hypothetical protein